MEKEIEKENGRKENGKIAIDLVNFSHPLLSGRDSIQKSLSHEEVIEKQQPDKNGKG
jgi:hypothetical protein